jgi:hypothetical protein
LHAQLGLVLVRGRGGVHGYTRAGVDVEGRGLGLEGEARRARATLVADGQEGRCHRARDRRLLAHAELIDPEGRGGTRAPTVLEERTLGRGAARRYRRQRRQDHGDGRHAGTDATAAAGTATRTPRAIVNRPTSRVHATPDDDAASAAATTATDTATAATAATANATAPATAAAPATATATATATAAYH